MHQSPFRLAHREAIVKTLVTATGALSLFTALTASIPFVKHLTLLLSISPFGIKHFLIFQALTHVLISPVNGLFSVGYLLNLFFELYILYVVGSQICQKCGVKHFLSLYLGSAGFSGLAVMLLLKLFPVMAIYSGPSAALMALLLAFAFFNPQGQMLLFMTIPVKIKWLIAGLLSIKLLVLFANGIFVEFVALASAILFGYFYALIAFETHSPYLALHPFETRLLNLKRRFSRKKPAYFQEVTGAKVYDFKSGKAIIDDDAFMDACLAKIARKGKSSLTFFERWRLRRISKRKRSSS